MSRIRRLGVLLALALLGADPGVLQAQQTEEELLQRLDSLLPLRDAANEEAHAAVLRYEAAQRAAQETTVDTFMVGPLQIVAPLDQVGEATGMFKKVWEAEFAPVVTHSDALNRYLFTFNWSTLDVKIVMTGDHARVEARRWHTRAEVERRVKDAIGKVLDMDLKEGSSKVFAWARGTVGQPENPDLIYRQLATTPSRMGRACLEGVPGACWEALGVEIKAESRLNWYTAEERQKLALGLHADVTREAEHVRAACARGDFDRCDELLDHFADVGSLIPLPSYARMAMVWVALETGGEGAWDRLVEDPQMAPAEALLHASGASEQQLEASWRTMVLENRPQVHAGLSMTKWTALFWILILAALAMRSTRWRLA